MREDIEGRSVRIRGIYDNVADDDGQTWRPTVQPSLCWQIWKTGSEGLEDKIRSAE